MILPIGRTLRYRINLGIVELFCGCFRFARMEIKVCPQCHEKYVTNSIPAGLRSIFEEMTRVVLHDHGIHLGVTETSCEECRERQLAFMALLTKAAR